MNAWGRTRLWLTAALLAGQVEAMVEAVLAACWPEKDFLRVKVRDLTIDPSTSQPVVVLADEGEERALIVWIGPCEASAISAEIQGVRQPRPSTHDLAGRIIQRAAGTLQRIMVTHSRDNTYFATIVLGKEDAPVEIDARPSDSIA
ncbi:MAG: bifunctional nuclease family protein, partial [Deltaproteobacteria bacterium]|nr:bifunctional nuclease family protein [Deltaproteobacteria bacterium]